MCSCYVCAQVSLINFVASLCGAGGIQAFKTMRTLRALRPLRALSRMQGMRVGIQNPFQNQVLKDSKGEILLRVIKKIFKENNPVGINWKCSNILNNNSFILFFKSIFYKPTNYSSCCSHSEHGPCFYQKQLYSEKR